MKITVHKRPRAPAKSGQATRPGEGGVLTPPEGVAGYSSTKVASEAGGPKAHATAPTFNKPTDGVATGRGSMGKRTSSPGDTKTPVGTDCPKYGRGPGGMGRSGGQYPHSG